MEEILLSSFIANQHRQMQEFVFMLYYWFARRNFENSESFITNYMVIFNNVEHIRMSGYVDWLRHYLDYDFFSIFRMNKETFIILLNKLRVNERFFRGGEPPISPEQQLLITLWWLGKGEVLLTIADRFNVVVSTVYKSTEFMLSRILNLQQQYVVWPNRLESVTVARAFEELAGYPDVLGAIDVCNIHFKAPSEHQREYIDRKMNHSIKLQAVVTSEKIFINTMVGFPGSVHDSRVLRNSHLYHEVQNNGNAAQYFCEDQYHIVGDSAYPLHHWLMKPYRDNGHLTVTQKRHNKAHSRTRVVVEQAFGILISRWRILKFINVNSIIKSVRIITACCILHNFCYINLDVWNDFEEYVRNDDEEEDELRDNNLDALAALKRDRIARRFQ